MGERRRLRRRRAGRHMPDTPRPQTAEPGPPPHAPPPEPPPPDRRRLRRLGIGALIVAILLAGIGIFWRYEHRGTVQQWTDAQAIPSVVVVHPTHGPATFELVLPGDVQAWYEAPIYARVSGYLKDWYFDYGARVKRGDLLAEITAPDLDGQYDAARAKLRAANADVLVKQALFDYAKTTYDRWKNSPIGVVSAQEREDKRGAYGSALASLNAAKELVMADQGDVDRLAALESYKRITAPFDGYVTARETDIGALINAGSGIGGGTGPELFRVADVHEMRVYVLVPQTMSDGIRPGMKAELHLPQFDRRSFPATVATTSRAIAMSSRTLLVELHAPNPDGLLQPGSYAEVHFIEPATADRVMVPTSALLFRERGLEVAVVGPDDKVELRRVTPGRNLGTEMEILSGVSPSDRIIYTPPDSVADGDLVHVENAPKWGTSQDRAAAAKARPPAR
jgi:RND family efflux transporter MFP subunit